MHTSRKLSLLGLKLMLASALAFGCASAEALFSARPAWGDTVQQTIYTRLYFKDGEHTFVLQESPELEAIWGENGGFATRSGITTESPSLNLYDGIPIQGLLTSWTAYERLPDLPRHIAFSGNIVAPTDMAYFFQEILPTAKPQYDWTPLKTIDLRGLNTSTALNMKYMFKGCTGLTHINLTPLDTSRVTNMQGMFYGCSGLTSLDLTPLDTSKVTDMCLLFLKCSGLTSLDLTPLNTSSATSMYGMFHGCSGLTSLDLSPLDTSKATSMYTMFKDCSRLKYLDLTPVDTSSSTVMQSMFEGCSQLRFLDLTPLDTSNVTNMISMFSGCSELQSLDLSSFDTSKTQKMSKMLEGCSKLSYLALRPGSKITDKGFYLSDNAVECISENPAIASLSEDGTSLFANALGSTRLQFTVMQNGEPITSYLNVTVKNPEDSWDAPIVEPDEEKPVAPPIQEPNTPVERPDTKDPIEKPVVSNTIPASEKISIAGAKIVVGDKAFIGKKLFPTSFTVKLNGKVLRRGVDYTVSCRGGKAVGSYNVLIRGKGVYTSTKSAVFRVVPKAISTVKVTGSKKRLAILWAKPSSIERAQVTGYQVRYSTAKSMKGAKVVKIKGSSKTSAVIKKLKGGKKYYVQIRAYKTVKGKTYYSAWSAVKSVKTKK